MKPLPTVARLGALVFALNAVGCISEDVNPGADSSSSGGPSVSKGGANSSSAASGDAAAGGTTAANESTSNVAGASVAAAGTASGQGGGNSTFSGAGMGGVGRGGVGPVAGTSSFVVGTAGTTAGGAGPAQAFSLNGTVTGLIGTGLSLSVSTGAPLKVVATIPIAADGAFSAPIQIPGGSAVKLGVVTQPTGPHQICTVSESGTIPSLTGNVTDIAVTCAVAAHAVGGTISGLQGSGLVLQINGGEELTMGGNGRFAFPTKILSGLPFTVTVKAQPNAPNQTCTVSGGSGIIGAADVPSIAVNCATNSFIIGGVATGVVGSGLTLLNNGSDPVKVTSNGSFAFATPVLSGGAFAVSIQSQPVDPVQTCVLGSASGTVANTNVASVAVTCTTNTYTIRGNVVGLAGSGLTLQNNLSDNLAIAADGPFGFGTKLASGADYSVTVQAQPTTPAQDCIVSSGTGKLTASDATVQVTCTTKKYSVGGTVSGMVGTGLVLRNNGADDLTINGVGPFVFPTQVASSKTFAVTIAAQPPGEFCTIGGDHGTIGTADVNTVRINCSDKAYMIGGTVTGLEGSGLQIALNDKAPMPVTSSSFAFSDFLAKGDSFAVQITQSPTNPWQTCTLKNAQGTVGTTNVSDVEIECKTSSFTVGGTVTGLAPGAAVVLWNNGGDDLTLTADGQFTFPTAVLSNKPYLVSVHADPSSPAQTCTVSNAGGTVGGANIANVSVTCTTNTYSVAGTISGLVGSVVLANNTTDTLTLTANGTFKFAGPVASGKTYEVKVIAPPMTPAAQDCTVTNETGTVTSANVTNVSVVCVTKQFTIGGRVTGLDTGEQLVLQNNGGDDLTVLADGQFTFATPVASANAYRVTLLSAPLAKDCTVSGDRGTVGSADVTSVSVNCSTQRVIGGTITGVSGSSGLVLHNGNENLAVNVPGTFAFKTLYADGSPYDVSVVSQPTSPWQSCTVTGGKGIVNGGDINSITVVCTPIPHTVSVNVTGLANSSTGLVLQNNNADNLSITGNGVFSFSTNVASGDTYSVRILTQPTAPSQTCTVSSETGRISNADVTVNVNCVSNAFTVGGTVYGSVGTGLVLRNNGGNDLNITSTGTFTFTQRVGAGTNYAVSIATHPSGFRCAVSSGTGTVGSANVTNVRVDCPAFTFDADVDGWFVKNGSAGLSWTGSVGSPDAGALQYQAASASCGQVMLEVNPVQKGIPLDGTGKTVSLWVRFDTFPSNPVAGSIVLYAQDSEWRWQASTYALSSFTLGAWKELTLTFGEGKWASIQAIGLRLEGASGTCQAAKLYVDSVQIR